MQAQVRSDGLLGVAVRLARGRAAGMPPDLGAQAVRKGGLAQHALRGPVPPQRPALPPRADTLAIARLRRGLPGGRIALIPPAGPVVHRPRVCDAQRPGQRAAPSHPGDDVQI